jgi:signal transduction histidine kinase
MNRRYWPAALALLALLLFGSYLGYMMYIARHVRDEAEIHSRMYAAVQRGLASPGDDNLAALIDLQSHIKELNIPLVVADADGKIVATQNLRFDSVDTTRLNRYVNRLRARRRFVETPNLITIYYGDPPIVGWLRWIPWLQAGGGIVLALVAVAIIRADVRAERERMWAAMARELAHQMGTPLSSLVGWIEVLQLPAAERGQFGGDAKVGTMIGSDVERLDRVSRRFELIGQRPSLEVVDVRDVLAELEQYFRPRLPRISKEIRLRVQTADTLPTVEANRVLLAWALENIIKNAIDALAGRGGRILISASADANSVWIRIADNGPGIAPEVRGRIFETGVSTKSSGWGVGLALTRRIIENLHSGRITVRDRRRGGTIFEIQLPAAGHHLRRRFFGRP